MSGPQLVSKQEQANIDLATENSIEYENRRIQGLSQKQWKEESDRIAAQERKFEEVLFNTLLTDGDTHEVLGAMRVRTGNLDQLRQLCTSVKKGLGWKLSGEVKDAPIEYRGRGIENVGNTCWLNSCLQLIDHAEGFRDLLMVYKYRKNKNPYQEFVTSILFPPGRIRSRAVVEKARNDISADPRSKDDEFVCTMLKGSRQQDAWEGLLLLFGGGLIDDADMAGVNRVWARVSSYDIQKAPMLDPHKLGDKNEKIVRPLTDVVGSVIDRADMVPPKHLIIPISRGAGQGGSWSSIDAREVDICTLKLYGREYLPTGCIVHLSGNIGVNSAKCGHYEYYVIGQTEDGKAKVTGGWSDKNPVAADSSGETSKDTNMKTRSTVFLYTLQEKSAVKSASVSSPVQYPEERKIDMNATYVIVGAGPVGLFLAARLLDTTPTKETIIMIEKRSTEGDAMSRDQQYFIDIEAFDKLPTEVQINLRSEYTCQMFRPPRFLDATVCYSDLGENPSCPAPKDPFGPSDSPTPYGYSVKTSTLQKCIYEYIKKKNIGTHRFEILFDSELEEVADDHIVVTKKGGQNITVSFEKLILASGNSAKKQNDVVYDRVFQGEGKKATVKYIGQDFYTTELSSAKMFGAALSFTLVEPKSLSPLKKCPSDWTKDNFSTQSREQHRFRLFRQQNKDVYIGINLREDEYVTYVKFYQEVILKQSGAVNWAKISAQQGTVDFPVEFNGVLEQVNGILMAYTGLDPQSFTMEKASNFSIFPITLNKSKVGYFTTRDAKRHVFFAGDAAINIHYFAAFGINMGIYGGKAIVDCITAGCTPYHLAKYDQYLWQKQMDVRARVGRILAFPLWIDQTVTRGRSLKDMIRWIADHTNIPAERLQFLTVLDVHLIYQYQVRIVKT